MIRTRAPSASAEVRRFSAGPAIESDGGLHRLLENLVLGGTALSARVQTSF